MADPIFVAAPTAPIQVGLNISDVIDIIGHDDPEYESTMSIYEGVHGGGAPSEAISTLSGLSRSDPEVEMKRRAYVKIIEQPQAKALRFRYICEGRSAGSIPGVRSTAENKTYPAIQVHGYKGPAVVVVSCVTMDPPYRPHPHNLVGKEGCKKGVCTMNINNDSMQCIFSNLGIQCVKKKDVEDALRVREEIRVDPFQTGFGHRNQTQSIDLNALRLCFQVFLEGSEKGKFTLPLKAVVSDPIYDKKATSDLVICKLSDCSSSAAGGKEIILLCDKVTKEDIQVKFYEVKDGMIAWESLGDFQASDVHKQVAISFKTPRYKSLEIENPVKVYIQLLRPSDKSTSEPRPFEYLPLDSDPQYLKHKMAKHGNLANTDKIGRFLAENMRNQLYGAEGSLAGASPSTDAVPRPIRVASRSSRLSDKIKIEPPDPLLGSPVSPGRGQTPSPAGGAIIKQPISPQQHPVYNTGRVFTGNVPVQGPSLGAPGPYYPQGVPRVPSPHQQQPLQQYPIVMAPHMSSQYPQAPAGGGPYQGSSAGPQGPAISQLLDLDSQKCIEHHSIELDINQLDSGELQSFLPSESDFNTSIVDAHLSENLSSNLNIIDTPPTNKLDLKINGGTGGVAYIHNIPPHVDTKVGSVPVSTDSLNKLTSELQFLNQH